MGENRTFSVLVTIPAGEVFCILLLLITMVLFSDEFSNVQ